MNQVIRFDIFFPFRGKERKARVRKYVDRTYSISLVGEKDLIEDFHGLVYILADGSFDYFSEIKAKDKSDFETGLSQALQKAAY